jgi:hypothetical protein
MVVTTLITIVGQFSNLQSPTYSDWTFWIPVIPVGFWLDSGYFSWILVIPVGFQLFQLDSSESNWNL